ncbi:hypothetical protein Lal_00007488 [Lupinus albus]|nr:hypothetical protein Lal_00007488 [Lupinus albus]
MESNWQYDRIGTKMLWVCKHKTNRGPDRGFDQMLDSSIIKGKERPRKPLDETTKKYLDLNGLPGDLVFDRTHIVESFDKYSQDHSKGKDFGFYSFYKCYPEN